MPVGSPPDPGTQTVERPPVEDLDSGVIKEARRRQRIRRVGAAGAMLAAAGVLLGAFLLASGGGTNTGGSAGLRPSEPLPRLTGRALTGPSGLLIVAHGNEGPAVILNVDRHTVDRLRGLGLPLRRETAQSPLVGSLSRAPGGVLAVVQHARSQTAFLIAPDGAVRHLVTLATHPRDSTLAALDADAIWVLTWPQHGSCTLRLAPGTRPAVPVPCGSVAADTTAGVWIATAHQWAIVDPSTGRTRAHATVTPPANPGDQVGDQLFALQGDLALESLSRHSVGASGGQPAKLRLVNLISGHRRRLVWPSYFGDIIRVVPEPDGPLVAVDFGSPAYPGPAQADDVWMLDTTTGTFTHVPGYPAGVDIKFSDIAWTTNARLVIIAQGGGRTVLGVWEPGQPTLRLRTVPSRDGYHFVPLAGPS
jgi:hypothetical protein